MKKNSRVFYITYSLLCIISAISFLQLSIWNSKPVIDWDISQYYTYLPATFIYQDFHFEDQDSLWHKAHFKHAVIDGTTLPVKMTYGASICYAPFFLAAHGYALYNDTHSADAFSKPYKIGLLASSLVFALIGLWYLGNWLQFYVSSFIASVVTVALFIGTNLPHYTFVEPMSHAYGFALFSALLYFFYKYRIRQSMSLAIGLGLLAGLLVLLRPTNIVLLLFPLISLFFQRKQHDPLIILKHALIAGLLAILLWVPQFVYWKHMTGQWFFYSYNEEGFFFSDPKLWKGLFSYRKGWFIYSPLLFLALPGFYFLFKKNRTTATASLITLFVGLWITFSWWCWWYGGSFGARALIEYLPFMGLSIASLLAAVAKKGILPSVLTYTLIVVASILSLHFNILYSKGLIHPDSMSKALFWEQITEDNFVKNYPELLDPPDYDKAKRNEEF
ncbi:hypothetical protein [Owenweeksia hongkongensis]|uniref:SLC41A family transporter n=1 Tax=Owenweeksia hongkongensis TaxID=253245 RepID=UPI003A928FE8